MLLRGIEKQTDLFQHFNALVYLYLTWLSTGIWSKSGRLWEAPSTDQRKFDHQKGMSIYLSCKLAVSGGKFCMINTEKEKMRLLWIQWDCSAKFTRGSMHDYHSSSFENSDSLGTLRYSFPGK